MIRLLRVPLALSAEGLFPLSAETATYVTRVHRLGPGARFVAFDPERALEADASIVEVGKRGATVRIEPTRPTTARPRRSVTLIQGTGKGDKMDAIVRDATELGATRIVPAITARSVSRPEAAKASRWLRIAVEASRQCGRGDAPTIDAPSPLATILARGGFGEASFALDPTAPLHLGDRLAILSPSAEITLLIGPEGGLTEDELAAAERASITRVRLGGFVLRTETVCAAVLGAILVGCSRP